MYQGARVCRQFLAQPELRPGTAPSLPAVRNVQLEVTVKLCRLRGCKLHTQMRVVPMVQTQTTNTGGSVVDVGTSIRSDLDSVTTFILKVDLHGSSHSLRYSPQLFKLFGDSDVNPHFHLCKGDILPHNVIYFWWINYVWVCVENWNTTQ